MIGNYHFASDYGCPHPGMPLCLNNPVETVTPPPMDDASFSRHPDSILLPTAARFARLGLPPWDAIQDGNSLFLPDEVRIRRALNSVFPKGSPAYIPGRDSRLMLS